MENRTYIAIDLKSFYASIERFRAVMASVLPDYEARRARLKKLQKRFATEDWD